MRLFARLLQWMRRKDGPATERYSVLVLVRKVADNEEFGSPVNRYMPTIYEIRSQLFWVTEGCHVTHMFMHEMSESNLADLKTIGFDVRLPYSASIDQAADLFERKSRIEE